MKKICIITTVSGTLESFVIPTLELFAQSGYDITLVSNMSDEFLTKYSPKYNCINIPMKRGIYLIDCIKVPFFLYNLFKKNKYDIIQYATPNAALYSSIGALLARAPKRVYCQWGIRYVGKRGIMRWILKQMEYITCLFSTHIRPASRKNLAFSVEEGLYIREKASVIGDGGTVGVDLKEYNIEKKTEYKSEIRDKYSNLRDKYVYCFVGRFSVDKGCNELLKAFKRLLELRKDIALLIIGNFEEKLAEEHKWILNSTNVVMTGTAVHDVYRYLAASDVLVHPSYREGFSMVIQEAMAMALPVITTDIPGPSEVIENNKSGLLVNVKDVESLFKSMMWILDNRNIGEGMGYNGRKRCEILFNRDRMIKLTLDDRNQILDS